MTRWIGAGLLAFLVIAGVFFAHRASAGGDESAAGDVESAHVRMPAATHSPGTQTDARAPEFGLIGDARMGDAGRMYLLDVMERRVGVSAGGDTIVWTGRIGRGPGEFFVPVALAAGADVLYVLDRGNQRIEQYRTADGGLERTGSLALELNPKDLGLCQGRLYILGAHQGHALHEISPRDGKVIRSFAPDPQLDDPLRASYRAGGHLACGHGDEIVFLPQLRPEVLRFSLATGALLATVSLPRYNAVRIRNLGDAVSFQAENGAHDVGISVLPLPDGRVLVQAGEVRQETGGDEFSAIRSYVVDWRQPAARVLSETLPRITDLRDGWALAVETDPEPAVRRIRFTLPAP
jgi:hypothetical protein